MDAGNRRVLTEAEIYRLRAAASATLSWRLAVELMLGRGLRRGEIFALRAGDVDLVSCRLLAPRVVDIPGEILEDLRRQVEHLDEDDLVFDWHWYQARVRREWHGLTRSAGIEGLGMHALRATWLLHRIAAMRPGHRSADDTWRAACRRPAGEWTTPNRAQRRRAS